MGSNKSVADAPQVAIGESLFDGPLHVRKSVEELGLASLVCFTATVLLARAVVHYIFRKQLIGNQLVVVHTQVDRTLDDGSRHFS